MPACRNCNHRTHVPIERLPGSGVDTSGQKSSFDARAPRTRSDRLFFRAEPTLVGMLVDFDAAVLLFARHVVDAFAVTTPSKSEAIIAVYVVGALLLVLVAFAAGLFARSLSTEKDAVSLLEDKVLN
jgi:hypothetical protein